MPISMTALTWMVKSIPNRNTIEDFTEEIDEAGFVRRYNCSNLLMTKLYLSLALINLLLGVVHHSSSLVTMAIRMSHWDVTSDYLSQVRVCPVWITILDLLLPPDMLAMRTAGPKWNHAKLYGSFAALWFFLMEKDEDEKWNLSLSLNGQVYAVIFVNDPAIMNQKYVHWTMTGSIKILTMTPLPSLDTATCLH